MRKISLNNVERAVTGATHKIVIDHTDLKGATNTESVPIADVPAGTA